MSVNGNKSIGPGNRICGTLRVFDKSELMNNLNIVIQNGYAPVADYLAQTRELLKQATAICMDYAFKPIVANKVITQMSKFIIENWFNYVVIAKPNTNLHIIGFVDCTIDYYNKVPAPNLELPMLSREPNFHDVSSAWKRQYKNLEKLIQKRLEPAIEKMRSNPEFINGDYIAQFTAIPSAIIIVCQLLRFIYCETIPDEISADTYNMALQYDDMNYPRINDLYQHNPTRNTYYLKHGKKCTSYNALTQECAICLICPLLEEFL